MKLSLPHDAWADLREADEIPRKLARKFREVLYRLASSAEGADPSQSQDEQAAAVGRALIQSEAGLGGIEDMADAMVFAVVADWSYGDVTPDVLEMVPDAAIQAIYDQAVEGGYIDKLMPDFSNKSPEGNDPDNPSPTGLSGG